MARTISVTVKPNPKSPGVSQVGERDYRVSVREPALHGKANQAAIALLARHFSVVQSRVKIRRGETSRNKIVDIC